MSIMSNANYHTFHKTHKAEKRVMSKNDVEAEILNLSTMILLGKATEKEIETVCKLASEHDCIAFLHAEVKSISDILTS